MNCQYCECELDAAEQKKKDFDGEPSLVCDDCEHDLLEEEIPEDDWFHDDPFFEIH